MIRFNDYFWKMITEQLRLEVISGAHHLGDFCSSMVTQSRQPMTMSRWPLNTVIQTAAFLGRLFPCSVTLTVHNLITNVLHF